MDDGRGRVVSPGAAAQCGLHRPSRADFHEQPMSHQRRVMTPRATPPPDHTASSRIRLWADLIARKAYRSIAEIGVWKGEFARTILSQCPEITAYWMIDPWRKLPDWNKPFNVTDEEFEAIYREALAATDRHATVRRVLRGTTAEVISQIPDGSLDFAYIDGDHSLRGITLDLLLVWPKIRPGGAIGGDDCCPSAWQHGASYEPTMVSPWVAYFAEAMRAPLTVLPSNQFLIRKSADGFSIDDQSGSMRDWSVAAHLGSSAGRSHEQPPSLSRRTTARAKRTIVRLLRRASPAFCEWDSARRFGPFPKEISQAGHLFIHVPKAAGSSFSLALYGRSFGHHTLAEWQANYPRSTANLRTIAVVRDPVDRFLSAFRYLKQGGMNAADARFARDVIGSSSTCSQFAQALLTPDVASRALDSGFHFRRQVDFLRDRSGRIAIDLLVPFERLDAAAPHVACVIGRPFTLPRVNETPGAREQLTDEARTIVERIYADDVRIHRNALEKFPVLERS
ncbi:MAG: class I SAM-dependent methyltransferase [Planctomycetia bacterium]